MTRWEQLRNLVRDLAPIVTQFDPQARYWGLG